MNCFKNRTVIAEVCAGNKAQAPDECGAQIRNDVAVEIFHDQHVVLIWIHHQLHTSVVDDVFAVSDLGKSLGHGAAAAQKQAIGELHDIGFMNGVNLLALVLAGVLEGKFGDAGGSLFRDDLQAFHNAWDDLVLKAGIEAFGILANDDEIDVRVAGGNVRQITDRAEVRVELEFLAQGNVDAGKAAAHRSGNRTF